MTPSDKAVMSEGDQLISEFKGQKITRQLAACLAMRIDGLIRVAVSIERHRCFDLVRDTMGRVIEAKSIVEKADHP